MADQPTNLIAPDDSALEDVKFIQREPILSSTPPGTAPAVNDPYQGAIISGIGLQTDTADSQLAGHLPVYRLMPSSVAGSSAAVSAATSTLLKNPEFVSAQAQIVQNTQAIAAIASQNIFLGAWSATTAYIPGNQVTSGGGYYICILANINQMPPNATYWQLVSSTNSALFLGAYNGATAYVPGNQVTYLGSYWICILATTGNAPSTTSTFWTLVGTSVILIGAWNSGTAYVQGNEVTFSGNVYQCVLANTNHTPPNATYWLLIGPASLDNVNDGTTRFAATASTLTYRPETNPITAVDAGGNVTINVASFTMLTSSKGAISITGSSMTALSYSTLYWVYYDDPTLAGGSVTFVPTTTKETAINGTGRFFVGSIQTPPSGGGTVTGNNDGGAGAQSGEFLTIFFSTLATTNTNSTITNPTNCNDGSDATFGSITSVHPGTNSSASITASLPMLANYSFQTATLNVKTAIPTGTGGGGVLTITFSYSTDGGATFTNIYSVTGNQTRAITVDSVSLMSPVNLSRIQIKIFGSLTVTGSGSYEIDFYEAWLQVTS